MVVCFFFLHRGIYFIFVEAKIHLEGTHLAILYFKLQRNLFSKVFGKCIFIFVLETDVGGKLENLEEWKKVF